jgi:hypothetical protein
MGYSHILIAIVYAILQLGINAIIIFKATNESLSLYFVGGFLLLLTFIYLELRTFVIRQVQVKSA